MTKKGIFKGGGEKEAPAYIKSVIHCVHRCLCFSSASDTTLFLNIRTRAVTGENYWEWIVSGKNVVRLELSGPFTHVN